MSRSSSIASVGSISEEEPKSKDNVPYQGSSMRSGSRGVVVVGNINNGQLYPSGGTILLQNVSSTDIGGGEVAVVGGGDHEDDSDELPKRTKKKSKKMLLLWSLVVYCVICSVFFLTSCGIVIAMWFHKMNYFIRESDVAPVFDVIPNVFWIFFGFLVGSLIHVILTIFTIFIFIGIRLTENMVLAHKEKLMMWVFITACIGEYIMFSGTVSHMGGTATVENGQAKDTLLPNVRKLEVQKCFDPDIISKNNSRPYLDVNLVQVNLKWMTQVSCGKSSIEHQTFIPTWQLVLDKIFTGSASNSGLCKKLKSKLAAGASRDCSLMQILDGIIFAWLILDGLGIWFCVGLFYLYLKAVVRMKPGRFSFAESTYQDDIEALKQIATRMRKFKKQSSIDSDKRKNEKQPSSPFSKKANEMMFQTRNEVIRSETKDNRLLQSSTVDKISEPRARQQLSRQTFKKKTWKLVIKKN